jgi:hypothetical protein
MSLQQLEKITQGLHLVDTASIIAQGRAAYRAGFLRSANPRKLDRDRDLWDKGYREEEERFTAMLKRWRETDRGQR